MEILSRSIAIIVVALGTFGCASTSIRSDYDASADWAQYETYDFYPDAGPDAGQYQSFFTRYMIEAITLQMENRGYVRSDDPDLLVNFNARLEDRTQVTTSPGPSMGMYYGYRRGFYSPWAGYGFATETTVSQYTEGTFNIDVVDARRRQLVWEAVGNGRVTQSDVENMEQRVREGVPEFFETFPSRAGQPSVVSGQE